MTNRPGKHPRITREELDRLFDREMDQASRRDLVGRLGRDQDAIDEVNDVRGIVHSMRLRPDETPDMTASVLARLDGERGFVPARVRRRIKAGRIAAAACLLLGLLGVAIGQRVAPDRFRLQAEPTPVADLTDAVRQDSAETGQRLADTVRKLASAHAGTRLSTRQDTETTDPTGTADISKNGQFNPVLASVGADDNPGLAVPVAKRYLTLTVSTDAEILAFNADTSSFVVPEPLARAPGAERFAFMMTSNPSASPRVDLGLSLAFASTAEAHAGLFPGLHSSFAPAATANTIPTIEAGVLPLSFSSPTRSAYVGKRDPLAEAIQAELNGEQAERDPR